MDDAYEARRGAAMLLLTSKCGLTRKAGSFLGQCIVDPTPLTPAQAEWLDKLLDRAGFGGTDMSNVVTFVRPPVRAIVVEQLNEAQWHSVTRGGDVPAGSLEDRSTGVQPFAVAVDDALNTAALTGLPVFVEAYLQDRRPLNAIAPPSAFSRLRRGRSSLDEIMFGRGAA